MKLTSKDARELLENERANFENQRWINHSVCVGDTAGKIATALYKKDINVDVDKTIALGYIHDIGKKFNEHGEYFHMQLTDITILKN